MTKMFSPKINNPSPAAAPASPNNETPQRSLGDEDEKNKSAEERRRRGRASLRIDPQTGGVGSNGTGLNIPMK